MRLCAFAFIVLFSVTAHARDLDGQHTDAPLKDWFNRLASGKGLCCSVSDGFTVVDADWVNNGGHYRVRIPVGIGKLDTIWVDVPDDAVIVEPNRIGQTIVWPTYYNGPAVRCFMPGSMS